VNEGERVAGKFHEDYAREIDRGSDKSFGVVFAVVFAIVGVWPLWDGGSPAYWAFGLSASFLVLALVRPRTLAPLNRLWHLAGLGLGKVVTPLVMGLIFFVTITPMALIMRMMGKDPLRLRFEPEADSYWIERNPSGPDPETLNRQF
jgi:hypothetical protein